MGRGKLKMEVVTNEKKRNLFFKNNKATLVKRMHELSVLCDVKACMIIYYGTRKEAQIWPENQDEVRGLINCFYKNKSKSVRKKTYDLSDFFKEKMRNVKQDIAKIRKQTWEAKYPSWHESLDKLSESELRGFAEALGNKAVMVKSRIDWLKSNTVERFLDYGQGMDLMNFGGPSIGWNLMNSQQGIPFQTNGMLFGPEYGHGFYQNGVSFGNQNSMMNMLMNDTDGGDEFENGIMNPVNLGNFGPVGWFNQLPMLPLMPMPFQTYMAKENYYNRPGDDADIEDE